MTTGLNLPPGFGHPGTDANGNPTGDGGGPAKKPTIYDIDDAYQATGSTDPNVIGRWLNDHGFDTTGVTIPGADWTPGVDPSDPQIKPPGTDLSELQNYTGVKDPQPLTLENFSSAT